MDSQGQGTKSSGLPFDLSPNLEVFKFPRSFIKIFEWIFSIVAFATVANFTSHINVGYSCDDGPTTDELQITYPYNIFECHTVCRNQTLCYIGNSASDARFFVATGVLSFLFSTAAIFFYVFKGELYDNINIVPILDFLTTVFLAVFWLAGSAAWANGLDSLKHEASASEIIRRNPGVCGGDSCTVTVGTFAGLTISVIIGFLNFVLWAGNLWFLYKETPWFRSKNENVMQQTPDGMGPSAPHMPA